MGLVALDLKMWKSLCGSHSDLRSSRAGFEGFRVLMAVEEGAKIFKRVRVDRREVISMIRERVRRSCSNSSTMVKNIGIRV